MNGKSLNLILSLLLISSGAFFLYKYQSLKKDNLALKLKLKSASKEKRKAVTWNNFKEIEEQEANKNAPKIESEESNLKSSAQTVKNDEPSHLVPARDMETAQLINNLQDSLRKYWKLNRREIDQSLSIVDELISRNPNVYSSYKAKLILLLAKENAHRTNVDDALIENVLVAMSGFELSTDRLLRKEAFLIAKANSQADKTISQIELLENTLEETQEPAALETLNEELGEKILELESLENEVEEGLLDDADFLNEDVVEIPLYRSLANEDYQTVIEQSEDLVTEFPNSIAGHFFLIRALELSGRDLDAAVYVENLALELSDLEKLKDRLNRSRNGNPKNYWKKLRF